jgi:hypothetical protein
MPDHRIAITMTQETDGNIDNKTLMEEFSTDSIIHVVKTKVFVEAFTTAINEATQKLTDAALADLMGQPKPKAKKK